MNINGFGMASVALMLVACSTQPTRPAGSAPEAAGAAPVAAAPEATPAALTSSPDDKARELNRKLLAAGYKPTTIKGQVYYCRKEMVTNTAFKRTVCLDEAHLKDQEIATRRMQEQMLRMRTNPGCRPDECN